MPVDDRRIEELLRALDHPVPALTAEDVARRSGRRPVPATWAAAVLLTLAAAGAAFALPGSPLRRWVAAAVERLAGQRAQAPAATNAGESNGAGIAVEPGASLLVLFDDAAAGDVQVMLADRADVLVRSGSGRPSFTAGNARLLIDTHGVPDSFRVEIPREAAHVEIRAGPARLFLKDGERVTAVAPPDSSGVYRLRLPASHS